MGVRVCKSKRNNVEKEICVTIVKEQVEFLRVHIQDKIHHTDVQCKVLLIPLVPLLKTSPHPPYTSAPRQNARPPSQWSLNFFFLLQDEDTLELEDLDLDGDSLSSAFSAWRCPLLVRLTLLVVYTQFVVFHLLSADSATRGWLVPLPALHGLCLTRVVQILLVNGVYLWYLRAEE